MNGLNLSNIQDAKLGSSQVTALYYGSTKIWDNYHDYSLDYLTIEPTEDNDYGVELFATKSSSNAPDVVLSYSNDLVNWTTVTVNSVLPSVTYLGFADVGEKLYLKGVNNAFANNQSDYVSIFAQDDYKLSGNIMSLLYGDYFGYLTTLEYDYSFTGLFYKADNALVDISNLVLPATTLSQYCYNSLFRECHKLTAVPNDLLPAMTLSPHCYRDMFKQCTSLAISPALPATSLAESCYRAMFSQCAIDTAPELPATTLAYYCYYYMFENCTVLTTPPELPATTLAYYCYSNMFNGCSSLTTAPVLPATTLAESCYRSMFEGCESLTTASELPATTLAYNCYRSMFYNCASLTTAPVLPATTLVSYCYRYMFYGCTSLKYIECYATAGINSSNSTSSWVQGVAASGIFSCNPNTSWPSGNNGIPSGWTKDYWSYYKDEYFSVISTYNTSVTFYLTEDYSNGIMFQCSTDKTSWSTFNLINTTGQTLSINANQPLYFRIKTPTTTLYFNNLKVRIKGNSSYNIQGNINSLLFGEYFKNYDESVYSTNTFRELFKDDYNLKSAEWLVLPAMTLTSACYREMFSGCTTLTTPPKLPATTLAGRCYNYMFYQCSYLNKAPELPATTLAAYCYSYMFEGCRSLATPPELPATTLAQSCYANMFPYCGFTSISLPAVTTAERCYRSMFWGCTSLTSATILATSLATQCSEYMFYGCTNLSSITCMATSKESDSTTNWTTNVAASGTFTKNQNATFWTTGTAGIPSGWTIQNAT